METILASIFSEKGLVYGLFSMMIIGFFWKGIPFLINKFEAIVLKFTQTIDSQHEKFNKNLDTITNHFIKQIEESNKWHQLHDNKLNEHNKKLDNLYEMFINNKK